MLHTIFILTYQGKKFHSIIAIGFSQSDKNVNPADKRPWEPG